jgi:hypothetical protein
MPSGNCAPVHLIVVGDQEATFTGGDAVGGLEAEASRQAHGSYCAAPVAQRLGGGA